METKRCFGKNGCGEMKPLSEFPVQKSGSRVGYVFPTCKTCRVLTNNRWADRNGHCRDCGKEIDRRGYLCKACTQMKGYRVKIRNNFVPMTEQHYDEMFEAQGGKCAICSSTTRDSGKRRFDIDHCHDSDVVRGLLCMQCNIGLGAFKDDPDRIDKAIAYVRFHKERINASS